MTRAAIAQLLYLADEAFEGSDHGHSLLGNLRSVPDDLWLSVPPGGSRSVFDMVVHVGECKYVYENHAFGDGSMRWDRPGSIPSVERGAARDAIMSWLREGHRRWRGRVARLDDAGLITLRRSNWGQEYETRWLVSVLIQHDLYHAGEINHVRSVLQGDDRWEWEH